MTKASPVRLAAAVLLLAAPSARAQAHPHPHPLCSPGDRRLDPATCRSYRAQLDSAQKQKLPTEPLEDKASQGIASESDGPTIIAALQRLRANLYGAKQTLPGATNQELRAAADVLDAGATTHDLAVLWTAPPRKRSLETPLIVLVELSAQVPAADAVADVKYMLQVAVSDADFQTYQHNVQAQIALGGDPTIVANRLSRSFPPIPHR